MELAADAGAGAAGWIGTHNLQTVLASLPVVSCTEQTACGHARTWTELELSGKMIGYYNLIVAATALERGSEAAAFNRRHFVRVKRLTVIEPKLPVFGFSRLSDAKDEPGIGHRKKWERRR